MCRVMVYILLLHTHNWAQAVQSFEFKHDCMHMYY